MGLATGLPAAMPKKALVDWLSKGRPWIMTLKPKEGPKISWESASAPSSSPVSVVRLAAGTGEESELFSASSFRRLSASSSLEFAEETGFGEVTGAKYSEASDWVLNLKDKT